MRIFTYIIVFILVILGFTFACLNADLVRVNYYIGHKDIPLSLLLAGVLLIGAILGWLSSLSIVIRQKKEKFLLNQKLKSAYKEIENLRHIPLEDKH